MIRWSPASTVQHASENASRDVLSAAMCTEQSEPRERGEKQNKQNVSFSPSLLLFISLLSLLLRYQRLQSPPLVSGSQTFPVNSDGCKQGCSSTALEPHTCRLALTASLLRSRHTPIPVIPGTQSANTLFPRSLV